MDVDRRRHARSCDQCRKGKRACHTPNTVRDTQFSELTASLPRGESFLTTSPCSNCIKWKKQCTYKSLHQVQKGTPRQYRRKPTSRRTHDDTKEGSCQLNGSDYGAKITSRNRREQSCMRQRMSFLDKITGSDDTSLRSSGRNLYTTAMEALPMSYESNSYMESMLSNSFFDVHSGTISWSTSKLLPDRYNCSMISRNLLDIYHDTIENILFCWLKEKNCPYSDAFGQISHHMNPQESFALRGDPTSTPHRMCTRVCQLDRAFATISGPTITASEERAVSRAVHHVIMAYAIQWAKHSGQHPQDIGSLDAKDCLDMSSSSSNSEDPFSQRLWEQAYKAMQDISGIASFRAVFAHLVFGLVFRPVNMGVKDPNENFCESCKSRVKIGKPYEESVVSPAASTCNSCSRKLSHPSVSSVFSESYESQNHLETGIRMVFSLQRKLKLSCWIDAAIHDQNRPMRRMARLNPEKAEHSILSAINVLGPTEKETLNLVFWLCVMMDTVSAAMYHKPLIISNEDSDIGAGGLKNVPGQESSIHGKNYAGQAEIHMARKRYLWKDLLLHRDSVIDQPNQTVSGPCFSKASVDMLSSACPIKILLFRRVTQLQSLVCRSSTPAQIEEALKAAFETYRFWNSTYGKLINDCIANYENLPPQTREWYLLTMGHWHLAVFLLAEVVEKIDKGGIGLEYSLQQRQLENCVTTLKNKSALSMSDLAHVSIHARKPSSSPNDVFSTATVADSLLSSPWIAVLVQSFTRAGFVFVDCIGGLDNTTIPNTTIGDMETRCLSCIRALQCLGKQFHLGYQAAEILSKALRKQLAKDRGL